MSVFDRQIATAKRLIQKNGKVCTWTKYNNTVADSSKPWKTAAGASSTFQVPIVFLIPKRARNELFHLMEGTSVPDGAPYALMAAVPFVPEINDSISTGTDNFVIKAIDIVGPNGDPILYRMKYA